MLRLRITYGDGLALEAALAQEIAHGALLVKVPPPEGLEYREVVAIELASTGGSIALEAEVMSILPGAGVALALAPGCTADVRALRERTLDGEGGTSETLHEVVRDPAAPAEPGSPPPAAALATPGGPARLGVAERIRLALHGTRDDRATILREPDRALHAFVLKSPRVTLDEVTAWAKNPQMTAEFLKQIGDRKDWLSRASVAQALVRNPKTPPELALRALDYVGNEALRQMAKGGTGVPPHVSAAAKKKVMSR